MALERNGVNPRGCWQGLLTAGSCKVSKLEKTETLALVAMLLHLWHVVQRTGMLEKKKSCIVVV